MNYTRAIFAAAAVASLPLVAQAQPVSGPYIAGGLGANWLQDTTLDGAVNNALGSKIENEFEVGYIGVLSLGWGFGNGLRRGLACENGVPCGNQVSFHLIWPRYS